LRISPVAWRMLSAHVCRSVWGEIRFSVSWKAYCYADPAEERAQELARAAQGARKIGADVHAVAADRLGVEHVVEAHDLHHLHRMEFEDRRDLRGRSGADVAELALHVVERGQEGPAAPRILRDLRIDPLARRLRDHHSSAPFIHT